MLFLPMKGAMKWFQELKQSREDSRHRACINSNPIVADQLQLHGVGSDCL